VFPSAVHLAALDEATNSLLPGLKQLERSLDRKARKFKNVVKSGRTHLMDAVPVTLGQEFAGYAAQVRLGQERVEAALEHVRQIPLGGTATGTGLNTHPEFAARVCANLSAELELPLIPAANKFAALAGHEPLLFAHGAVKTLAAALIKIANDIRLAASGPRSGLGELRIPENEPGSSIMPGKVNPTQAEALTMAGAQVMGNDVAVNFGGASGHFELNVFKPMIIHAFLQSARLLADGSRSFEEHCARGIQADEGRIRELVERSLMLVTALSPHIGYDRAAEIAKQAHREGSTLREAALALGYVSAEDFDRWVRPEAMIRAR
jgi:fumarate hydratase class II